MRPTSSLRTAEHIDEAISLLGDNNVDSVVSIEPVKQHPYWMYIRHNNNYFVEYDAAKNKPERRQDLPELWITNDHTLLSTVNYLNEENRRGANEIVHMKNFTPYYISGADTIDIDSELDFLFAELLLQQRKTVEK